MGCWQRVRAPPCPLTLVLLHERPHVPLLRAVCEGAVPHILALAAVLRVDAELWGEGRASWVPLGCHHPGWRTGPPRAPWYPQPRSHRPCTPRRHSRHIAVGSCGWMAVASPTPISSWPWTSPEGPAAPWSSCRAAQGPVREGSGRASGYVTSTESPAPTPAPPTRPPAPSPVPGLGAAVLEVFVRLHHLPIPPALAAHKLHLQVKGAGPMCP